MQRQRGQGQARIGAADVQRERARADGARRLLPWSLISALGGAAIALAAGGGLRAAASLGVAGLLFAAFLLATSVARCPACGARLPRRAGAGRTGGAAPVETCRGCGTRFD